METKKSCPGQDTTIHEEQESKIIFLEWKANSDARASREKVSDLTWRIESLQKEIEALNHDRACLKMEIVRLEASLYTAEERLNLAKASQTFYDRLKQENNDHIKEIFELRTENRKLKNDRAQFSRISASKNCDFSDALGEIIRQCNDISENISKVICAELDYQSSIIAIKSSLNELRDSSISCVIDVSEIRNEITKIFGVLRNVAEGLKDIVHSSTNVFEESQVAMEEAKLTHAELADVKHDLSKLQYHPKILLIECMKSRREVDRAYQCLQALSTNSGTLAQLIGDCRAGVTELDAIGQEFMETAFRHGAIHESAREIVSRMHSYLGTLNLSRTSSRLTHGLQCLQTIVQRISDIPPPHDESLSDLSTVWADHDVSLRSPSQTTQLDFFNHYLKGMKHPRSGCGMCMLAGKIYFAGGTDGHGAWEDIEYFDLVKKKWGVASKMPYPRVCFNLVATEERLIAIGGEDADGNVMSSCIEFDPKTNSWVHLSPMNNSRTGFGALYLHTERIIVVSGGWDGRSNIASTEIYDVDRDTWIDSESSELLFSTSDSASGFTHHRSPVLDQWQTCSFNGMWRNQNDRRHNFSDKETAEPICQSLIAVERMMMDFVSDTIRLCDSLDKKLREQHQELYRYSNFKQLCRHKEKAEECFNRAKIDSLKSQLSAARVSAVHEARSRAGQNSRIITDVNAIILECDAAIQMISGVILAERYCLSNTTLAECQVHLIKQSTLACKFDVLNIRMGFESFLSGLHVVSTGMIDVIDLCKKARRDVENMRREASRGLIDSEQSEIAPRLYQTCMKKAADECHSAIDDVSCLKDECYNEFHAYREAKVTFETHRDDSSRTRTNSCSLAQRHKNLFAVHHIQGCFGVHCPLLTPAGSCDEEHGLLDEMMRFMRAEINRRAQAESMVEILTQLNFETTAKYQGVLAQQQNDFECAGLASTFKSDQVYSDEMLRRMMGTELNQTLEAERMVQYLSQIDQKASTDSLNCSETIQHRERIDKPVNSETSEWHQRSKVDATDSILVEGSMSDRVLRSDQGHLHEMMNLLGTEVIRRVEAEKMIEILTGMNLEIAPTNKDTISSKTSIVVDQEHLATVEKATQLELTLLQEEKGIVEAALELEIINNKNLRAEIFDLKFRQMHDDGSKEKEIQCLSDLIAAGKFELDETEKHVNLFFDRSMLLFSKLALEVFALKQSRCLCIKGQCETGQRLQEEINMLLDHIAHETEVTKKVRLLVQDELEMAGRQSQQWKEKYESVAKSVLQLEQQIALLGNTNEQSLLCNMELRRSLALVHSEQNSAASTLLSKELTAYFCRWRFSHHATKGCIHELLAEGSTTSSSDVSADDPEKTIQEKWESAISLSCRSSTSSAL